MSGKCRRIVTYILAAVGLVICFFVYYQNFIAGYFMGMKVVNEKEYKKIVDKDIYKVEVEIDNREEINKLTKINLNYSIFEFNNKMYLEFTNNKVSMFTGVDQISLRNNISLNEVLVIGGNESDIELVSNIPHNYVVANASKELMKFAKKKTTSRDEKGVEQVIKKV